jgi:parallel beta-helix repeat protein
VKRVLIALAFAGVLLAAMAAPAQAATIIRVPLDQPTIPDAISVASSGDTVLVAPGVCNETVELKDGVVVRSEAGAAFTSINGIPGYGVYAGSSVGPSTRLQGFTITNCQYGIFCESGSPTITDNIFTGNSTGIFCSKGSALITNNTFTDNTLYGIVHEYSSPAVTNNIVMGNGVGIAAAWAVAPVVDYNDVYGNDSDYVGCAAGANDISGNPKFMGSGNFHLASTSPCIDVGDDSAAGLPSIDFEGDPRVQDGDGDTTATVDMGADEYSPGGSHPHVFLSSSVPNLTNADPIHMTATFSKGVTGLQESEITVGNGSVDTGSLSGSGASYTFDVTPGADGKVTVDLPADVAQDADSHDNTAAVPWSVTYDGTRPGLTLSSTATSPTNAASIQVTATFTEPVSGFDLTDVQVANGAVANLSAAGAGGLGIQSVVGGSTYTFDVTPYDNGPVTVDVAANVAEDIAGNGNTAATQWSITNDGLAPDIENVSSTLADGHYRAGQLIPVTIEFSEAVNVGTTFGTPTLTLETGTIDRAATYHSGTGTSTLTFNYTVQAGDTSPDLDYIADGLALNGGTIKDPAGNDINLASLSPPGWSRSLGMNKDIVIDTSLPGLLLGSSAPEPTSTSPIPVSASFTEHVTGFALGDITIDNGTVDAGSFSGVNDYFTFSVTPAAPGLVTVQVSAGAAQDAAGNGNTVSNSLIRTYNSGTTTTFTITASAGAHGSISPKGSVTVTAGADKTFTITPATGYHVKDVRVDGTASVKPALVANGSGGYTYTFANVQANRTIAASFESNNTYFQIRASVSGFGGTISPAGPVRVRWSQTPTFTVTPYPGFHVDKVLVNGVPVTPTSGRYTFPKVEANHSIVAYFAQDVFVTYYWGGFLPPLGNGGVAATAAITTFRRGSTIPVEFRLLNVPRVTTATASLTVAGPAGFVTRVVDHAFAYAARGDYYFYRLRTTSSWPAGLYTLTVKLDDGTKWSTQVRLR